MRDPLVSILIGVVLFGAGLIVALIDGSNNWQEVPRFTYYCGIAVVGIVLAWVVKGFYSLIKRK